MKIKHLIYWSDPSQEHKNSLSPLIIDENGELKSELSEYISELSIYNSVSLLENLTYEKGPVCISTRMYTMKVSKDKCHMVFGKYPFFQTACPN